MILVGGELMEICGLFCRLKLYWRERAVHS